MGDKEFVGGGGRAGLMRSFDRSFIINFPRAFLRSSLSIYIHISIHIRIIIHININSHLNITCELTFTVTVTDVSEVDNCGPGCGCN